MIRQSFFMGAIAVAALLFGGCASTSVNQAPSARLNQLKSFYVVKLPADERGINQLISDELNLRGFAATTGAAESAPEPVDAVITYQDRWMWDITMYMIRLDMQVREPQSRMVLSSGRSYRPSLQRRSPEKMIQEVLDLVLNGKGGDQP